jgi:hypothetical protein
MKKMTGGYDNYSIRSATLVENYMPGPQRTNLLMDPDRALGKYDPGTFGADEFIMNGPGTISQALPDASKYNYQRIFANPRMNPYRNFSIDDRQTASYQVEQLHNNPLSQYTINPDGSIPGFECMEEPDNFSTMVNKRKEDYKNFFESGNYIFNYGPATQDVYNQNSGKKVNSNAEVVYNLSLDSKEDVNPMISLGSSSNIRNEPTFGGLCYSGKFKPDEKINNTYISRTSSDIGTVKNNKNICIPDKSLSFLNSLIL